MLSHSAMVRQRKQQASAIAKEAHGLGTGNTPCGTNVLSAPFLTSAAAAAVL